VNGPNAEGYDEACKKEYDTLEGMGVGEIVKRESWMNVLPCVLALQRKLYPDGTIKKLKTRLCAGGHHQIKDQAYRSQGPETVEPLPAMAKRGDASRCVQRSGHTGGGQVLLC